MVIKQDIDTCGKRSGRLHGNPAHFKQKQYGEMPQAMRRSHPSFPGGGTSEQAEYAVYMSRIISHASGHHLAVHIRIGHETEQCGKEHGDKSSIVLDGTFFRFTHRGAIPSKYYKKTRNIIS